MIQNERQFILVTTHINSREKRILTEQEFTNEELMFLVAEEASKDPSIRTVICYNKMNGEVLLEEHKSQI